MGAITEEMGLQKGWYEEARSKEMTLETLPAFLERLAGHGHDYGTICHALAAGAIAAATAMDRSECGGITGFQSGAVMWQFIREWMFQGNKLGLKILDYDNLLYPQFGYKFEKVITKKMAEKLKELAEKNLAESGGAATSVVEHWRSLAGGILPFGFVVGDDD